MMTVCRLDTRLGASCRADIREAVDYVNRVAGICRHVDFMAEVRPSNATQVVTGSYHPLGVITLWIPTRKPFQWDELLGAVAHEYKHHIQLTEAPDLGEFLDANGGEYWDQPCEVEAREFADQLVRKWWREESRAYFARVQVPAQG